MSEAVLALRNDLAGELKRTLALGNLDERRAHIGNVLESKKPTTDEAILKVITQLVFRMFLDEQLRRVARGDSSVVDLHIGDFLDVAAFCAEERFNDTNMFLDLLVELFANLVIRDCHHVFDYLEARMPMMQRMVKTQRSRLAVLKMGNEMLGRLSKATDTEFCGRVLIFMTWLLPMSDQSGVNLKGLVNSNNITRLDEEEEGGEADDETKEAADEEKRKAKSEQMLTEIEKGATRAAGEPPVDFNFYRRFWSMQKFFQEPAQLQDDGNWKNFTGVMETVLKTFSSNPFHASDNETYRRRYEKEGALKESFFVKYPTSSKLLSLQLNDPYFRRHILLQMLILFQSLTFRRPIKGKDLAKDFPESKKAQVRDYEAKVFAALAQTPPDGEEFAASVRALLQREENWVAWKALKCRDMERAPAETLQETASRKRKREESEGEETAAAPKAKRVATMGTAELQRLWSGGHTTLGGLSDKRYKHMPELRTVMDRLDEDEDPSAGIEETYKAKNEKIYMWRALRVMARERCDVFSKIGGDDKILGVGAGVKEAIKVWRAPEGGDEEAKKEDGEAKEKEEKEADDSMPVAAEEPVAAMETESAAPAESRPGSPKPARVKAEGEDGETAEDEMEEGELNDRKAAAREAATAARAEEREEGEMDTPRAAPAADKAESEDEGEIKDDDGRPEAMET